MHDRVQRPQHTVEPPLLEHGGDTALEVVRLSGLDARQDAQFGEAGTAPLDARQVPVDVHWLHALAPDESCSSSLPDSNLSSPNCSFVGVSCTIGGDRSQFTLQAENGLELWVPSMFCYRNKLRRVMER